MNVAETGSDFLQQCMSFVGNSAVVVHLDFDDDGLDADEKQQRADCQQGNGVQDLLILLQELPGGAENRLGWSVSSVGHFPWMFQT